MKKSNLNKVENKKHISRLSLAFWILTLTMCVFSFISPSMLTLPYLEDVELDRKITGLQLFFTGDFNFEADKMLTAFYIFGAIGTFLIVVFTIWDLFIRKGRSYAFFLLALACLCVAFSLAGLTFSLPIYKKMLPPLIETHAIRLTWQFYISLFSEIITMLLVITNIVLGSLTLFKTRNSKKS